ncbi:MAG: hypothetical protein IPF84_14745 [Proteobacteria bacterium]|nr:hypothetical protein [Pseudomonadota bacterium]
MPANLLFDQLKAVSSTTSGDRRAAAGERRVHALRRALGLPRRACRPYRAQTKGKVERPIGYVRQGFFYGRTFLNDADPTRRRCRGSRRRRTAACIAPLPRRRACASNATSASCCGPLAASVSVVGRDGPHARRSRPSQPPAMLQSSGARSPGMTD